MTLEMMCALLAGLAAGHFLNKCIYRLPRDLSVVSPPSCCPHCGWSIGWLESAPVLSYLVLRGRCRKCDKRYGVRYLVVELVTPALFVYYVSIFGGTVHALKYCIFSFLLVGLTFSGFETLLLPDEFTIGGLAIGLILSWFVAPDGSQPLGVAGGLIGLGYSLSGLLASATVWFAGYLFEKTHHREGIGFGDVKMLAMIGAFIGLGGAFLTVAIASILGSFVAFIYLRSTGKDAATYQLPTGPLWSVGALVATTASPVRWLWVGMNEWWSWFLGHF
jgi:leader peptidase (prepilin peptidase)/N-methyltransferase